MTIKDAFETEGLVTTSGAPELRDHVPEHDADAVARLRAAGAVIFGKTNLPLYAGDLETYNDVYGRTNNPWDLGRTVGGSSGGAAAALAAGQTGFELGSDIGGSIRNPAHYCGVFGLKPTWGIVSVRGHIPGPPGSLSQADVGVVGPMGRSAADLAPRARRPGRARRRRRGGVAARAAAAPQPRPGRGPAGRHLVRRAGAAAGVRRAGVARRGGAGPGRRRRPRRGGAGARPARRPGGVVGAPRAAADDRGDGRGGVRGVRPGGVAAGDRGRADGRCGPCGPSPSAIADWPAADDLRQHHRRRFAELFERYDVLLAPVMPTAAPLHGDGAGHRRSHGRRRRRAPHGDRGAPLERGHRHAAAAGGRPADRPHAGRAARRGPDRGAAPARPHGGGRGRPSSSSCSVGSSRRPSSAARDVRGHRAPAMGSLRTHAAALRARPRTRRSGPCACEHVNKRR